MWLEGHYKEKVNSVYQRHMGISGVKKKKLWREVIFFPRSLLGIPSNSNFFSSPSYRKDSNRQHNPRDRK